MNPRAREVLRFLPIAIVLYLLSRVLFDLIGRRPHFWSSEENFILLLWHACFAIPFIVFALMAAAARARSARKKS